MTTDVCYYCGFLNSKFQACIRIHYYYYYYYYEIVHEVQKVDVQTINTQRWA